MSFVSLPFLIFLPAVILLHWLTPHRFRWTVLLAASILFYASWNIPLTLLLVFVVLLTYTAGLLLQKAEKPAVMIRMSVSHKMCLVPYPKRLYKGDRALQHSCPF